MSKPGGDPSSGISLGDVLRRPRRRRRPTLIDRDCRAPLNGSRLRMLPAVAMRQLVPGNTWILDADDETPAGRHMSATANNLARRGFGPRCSAAPIYLPTVGQHILKANRPPHKLRRGV